LQPRRGAGIAAGKQRDIVTQRDELLSQPRDHTFGTTIQLGRNSFGERGYLRNTHAISVRSAIAPRRLPSMGSKLPCSSLQARSSAPCELPVRACRERARRRRAAEQRDELAAFHD